MSISKILEASLKEKGYTGDQIGEIQEILKEIQIVPYSRLADEITRRKEIEQTGKDVQLGFDKLQAEVASLREANSILKTELKSVSVRHEVENRLVRAGARNTSLLMRCMDLNQVKQAADGSFSGIDEQIEALKGSDGYLFHSETPAKPAPMSMPVVETTMSAAAESAAPSVSIRGMAPTVPQSPQTPQNPVVRTGAQGIALLLEDQYRRQSRFGQL